MPAARSQLKDVVASKVSLGCWGFFFIKKSNCLNSSDIFLCFPDGRVKNLQKIITFLPGKTVP